MECNSCNEDIEDNDYFECDGCVKKYHINCDKEIRKTDLSARKSSKRLKLLCKSCIESNESVQGQNVEMILRFIQKMDMVQQTQEKTQTQIVYDIERMRDTLEIMMKKMKSVNESNASVSYAEAVKNVNVNMPVIVKPVEKNQNSLATMDVIKKNIGFKEIRANGLKKTKDGGIAINCSSQAESLKIKELVKNKVGDKYSVEIPVPIKPRLKILNVSDEMMNDEIIENLKAQNELLEKAEISVKTVYNKKVRDKNSKLFDVVIETSQETSELLLLMKAVNLGWSKCKVVENIYIKRCFKCCGFNHVAKDCKNNLACSKCGGNHQREKCKSKNTKCVNCSVMCQKFNLRLNNNHEAYDKECEIYKRKLKNLKEKILNKTA